MVNGRSWGMLSTWGWGGVWEPREKGQREWLGNQHNPATTPDSLYCNQLGGVGGVRLHAHAKETQGWGMGSADLPYTSSVLFRDGRTPLPPCNPHPLMSGRFPPWGGGVTK